ncbi:anoctamin [Thioclava sp. DLFJ5-1]|uniref:anoctamin n=1 Tax=Thioclava sp. DLFJ5-1 TaxID=1915314 RepID=UPI00117CC364|nr:anoctamin [Thioclava sp. DLFJ5-1]
MDLAILVAEGLSVLVIIALWATVCFERRSWKRSNAPLSEEEVRWFNAQVEQLEKEYELEVKEPCGELSESDRKSNEET